jgi:hypothetical protein
MLQDTGLHVPPLVSFIAHGTRDCIACGSGATKSHLLLTQLCSEASAFRYAVKSRNDEYIQAIF